MSRIVLDSKSHQAIREAGTEKVHYQGVTSGWKGKRLSGLRRDLRESHDSLEIVDLETDYWTDASVLIIAGRQDGIRFSELELEKIARFSQEGGGLLLMANHPPGFVAPQNQVSRKLKLPVTFEMNRGSFGRFKLLPHEISKGCEDISIRTFCGLGIPRHSLECLGDSLATPIVENTDPNTQELAVAVEAGEGHGRVVALGSAGHIASLDDSESDLFRLASNAQWTLNCIDWLGRTG